VFAFSSALPAAISRDKPPIRLTLLYTAEPPDPKGKYQKDLKTGFDCIIADTAPSDIVTYKFLLAGLASERPKKQPAVGLRAVNPKEIHFPQAMVLKPRRPVDMRPEVGNHHIQCHIETMVIGNDKVGLRAEGAYEPVESGRHMVLVAVQHIVHIVAAFFTVAVNAPLELDVLIGIYEKLQAQLPADFLVVKHKNTLSHDDGCGSELQHPGNGGRVVEGIFFPLHGISLCQFGQIADKKGMIDAFGQIEIGNATVILWLEVPLTVVVVLRKQADFTL
jgi:hypothetical protein